MTTINFLLVDDEKPFVEVLAQRLQKRGYTVEIALSGKEALIRLDTDKTIDVVVLDVKMPDLDGIQTIQKLKETHPLVEVIMLTGQSTIHSAVEAIRFGAFDYLEKPCNLDLLISKAELAVSRKKDREARIFDVRITLYITKQERDDLISQILNS